MSHKKKNHIKYTITHGGLRGGGKSCPCTQGARFGLSKSQVNLATGDSRLAAQKSQNLSSKERPDQSTRVRRKLGRAWAHQDAPGKMAGSLLKGPHPGAHWNTISLPMSPLWWPTFLSQLPQSAPVSSLLSFRKLQERRKLLPLVLFQLIVPTDFLKHSKNFEHYIL